MEKKMGLAAAAAERFDLPAESVSSLPRVSISGGTRTLIENHRGILEYSRELIEINGGRVLLRFRGENLDLLFMDDERIFINGRIISAEFI